MLTCASLAAAWAGMAVLYFRSAIERQRQGLPAQSTRRRCFLLVLGAGLLALSLALSVLSDGASFGAVLWLSQTGIVGLALICWKPYAKTTAIRHSAFISWVVSAVLVASAAWL